MNDTVTYGGSQSKRQNLEINLAIQFSLIGLFLVLFEVVFSEDTVGTLTKVKDVL